MVNVGNQFLIAEEIRSNLTNFKKDGSERKSSEEYLRRKLNKLEELWKEFQFNHDRLSMEISPQEAYFTGKHYETAKETYNLLKQLINEEFRKIKGNPSATTRSEKKGDQTRPSEEAGSGSQLLDAQNRARNKTADGHTPEQQSDREAYKNHGVYSRMDDALRRQEANFRAFQRTIANIDLETLSAKWEYENALKTLNTRWSAIDALHLEIDSELNGENLAYEESFASYERKYNILNKAINSKMWSVSHREKTTPMLELPMFNGNYNQWVSFKDLFVETIHTNPTLSNAQKMQFLKAKIRGEAERLIQHLPITSDNYITCWEILNNRYDNKRMIFTSHMNILFGLPNIQQNSMVQIKRLHDVSMETFNAIKNLGIDTATWDPILVHILCQKLDSETYTDYLESLKNTKDMPILQELLDFLEGKFTTLETSARRRQDGQQKLSPQQSTNTQQHSSSYRKSLNTYNNYRTNGNYASIAKTFQGSGFKCPLCKGDHGIYNCKFFLQMPNDKKLNAVNRLELCVNCLFSHNGKTCNSAKKCRNCQAAHNTILHDALNKSTTNSAMTSQSKERTSNISHVAQTRDKHSEILLATAQVKVLGADGSYYNLRALVDQGSQISLISEQAAQTLKIKREKCRGMIFGIGQRENNCKGKIHITCKSNYNDYTFKAEVVIMNNLIKNLPNKTFSKPSWSNIQNIDLADPEFYISRPVDLLLGADVFPNIIMNGIIRSEDTSTPMAQQTQLGWMLCGSAETYHCNVVIDNLEDLQQFWEMEDITEEEDLSAEEIQCLKYFHETTTRKQDGRYEVRLPMKPNFETILGSSKQKAIAQFRNLERTFEKQPKLASDYKTFMNEYAELQHMTPSKGNKTLECYLPHHGIEKAESSTTQWDAEVPEEVNKEWTKAQADLSKLNEYEIPRWLNSREHDVIELHGFCDSSLAAFACVIYARNKHQNTVVLVAAKTKLVPIKTKITLPKLELSGSLLLANLMNKVKRAFEHHEIHIYGWTDSKVVLGWLQGEPSRWKPFVANRVKQITEVMPAEQWHYVGTSENPADAASRGLYASQLLSEQSLWKNGPKWLPTFQPENIERETFITDQEKKVLQSNVIQHSNNYPNIIEQLLHKYSSFDKIIHILAWIQRALTPKHKHRPSYLTLQDLRKAKLTIIKHVQQNAFSEELEHLRKHKCVQKQSKLNELRPFIDQQHILRVRGRLNQALINEEMKHPKIVPKDSRLATLLIDQAHKLTLHGGATVTLAALRQEYWITGGYNTVKRELRKCVTCRKQEGQKRYQLMGDLPAARCNPAKPFFHTGIDYTGAVDIKASKGRGAKTAKGYIEGCLVKPDKWQKVRF